MEAWWNTQNPDDVYYIATYDWSEIGVYMPYATEVYDYYSDFGNGYVPFFVVIGAYNYLMYGDNDYQPALDMVPQAIASFDEMGILNPIGIQSMFFGDELVFDLNDMFGHPTGEPVTVTLDGNTNPDVVAAEVTANVLTLNAQNVSGNSTISILGSGGALTCLYEFEVIVSNPENNYVLILDLDPTPTGTTLKTSIENFYTTGDIHIVTDFSVFSLENADAVFVMLGIYNMEYWLTEAEAGPLVTYLDDGGNVYMEGGDTWAYNPQTSLHPYFNITGLADGAHDLFTVDGHDFFDGMSWDYTGENYWIDHLEPIAPAVTIFSNTIEDYDCGIAYDSGTYKTVGISFEITGLGGTNSLDDAVSGIIDFFGIAGDPLLTPTNLAVNEATGLITWDAPVSEDLTGYNVYLDDMITPVATVGVDIFEYIYEDLVNGQTYTAGVSAVYGEDESEIVEITFTYTGTDAENVIVTATKLNNNYPNPFNPVTNIAYSIKEAGNVIIEVYNLRGQLVKTLVNETKETGVYTATWSGTDNTNKTVSSGVYFYKMRSGHYTATKKMILMK